MIIYISSMLLIILLIIFFYDIFQKQHAILRNFPIVGHFRYLIETIGPELRQYIVANDKEEMPFNRSERSWIYATSKKQKNTFGFGTTELVDEIGYPIIKHSAFPVPEDKLQYFSEDKTLIPCAKLIGEFHKRKKPYRPDSVINISAMSFGSLGQNAISALNKGAKIARCYHNTGEGGISPYHQLGADIVWQIGTGYFGARDGEGNFCFDTFNETIKSNNSIKMIEIKLSQGAKPGKGGILPKEKVNGEIAKARGILPDSACISPNSHSAFSNIKELVEFIEELASRSGLPIGIKSAVGENKFWIDLAKIMKEENIGPDFISIDGGEGGTGAAPLTFSDHVSLPFKVAFQRVYTIFQKYELENEIVFIGSGKLGFPDRSIVAFSMGCDMINIAREAMLSLGCIQAQKCHTDHCPAGVATQNKYLQRGLDVNHKSTRFAEYVRGLRKEILQLSHACGYTHPCQFTPEDIELSVGINKFKKLSNIMNYSKTTVNYSSMKDLFQGKYNV